MILALVLAAHAVTLDESVRRAAEVDPGAIVAALSTQQADLLAAQSWAHLGPSPSLSIGRTWRNNLAIDSGTFNVSLGALEPGSWFRALQRSSQATASRYAAAGTTLDAQYAAAALYVGAWEAKRAVAAARDTESAATSLATAIQTRVGAGLDGPLLGRSAEAGRLLAVAERIAAEAQLAVARVQLARALELDDVGELDAPPGMALPGDAGSSPWLDAAKESVESARWRHIRDLAGWFPSGGLNASTPLGAPGLAITLSATWTLDGVVAPFLLERQSALAVRIADVQFTALRRDYEAGLAAARVRAIAAGQVLDAHRARQEAADAALAEGRALLDAGLVSTLEVLRLQDQLSSARTARVGAELDELLAILDARRLAGEGW
ncbi:MAG: TolC family protein [Myxococcales bacterium]|nr:TolC family protein [Myxococcales bacterium]